MEKSTDMEYKTKSARCRRQLCGNAVEWHGEWLETHPENANFKTCAPNTLKFHKFRDFTKRRIAENLFEFDS